MRFEIRGEEVYFLKEKQQYRVASEDIPRLVARRSTRVLRLIDEKGKMTSLPIDTAIGEIEGYQEVMEKFGSKNC